MGRLAQHLVILALALGALVLGEASGTNEPIRILSIGAVLPGDTPIVEILAPEPSVQQTLVPTRRASEMEPKTAQRYVRLYFPKTYDRLREYGFIMYVAAPDVRPLTTIQMSHLRRATEEGIAAFADQGGISGYEAFEAAWMASGLHEMFPNDAAAVVEHGVAHSLGLSTFRVSISMEESLPEVLKPFSALGIEDLVVSHGFYVVPRQGATIWGEMKGLFPEKGRSFPWLMSMEFQAGLTWNLGDNFISTFWASKYGEMYNPFRTDVLMNVILFSVGRDLPDDILLVHNQRRAFGDYIQRRRFALEVVNFAETFGARVAKLYSMLEEADSVRNEAQESYLNQDYEASTAAMAQAFGLMADLNSEALKAKDTAMMWVFASEWMVLTGTSIVAGWALHFLMIRRRLYSEAGRTAYRRGDG